SCGGRTLPELAESEAPPPRSPTRPCRCGTPCIDSLGNRPPEAPQECSMRRDARAHDSLRGLAKIFSAASAEHLRVVPRGGPEAVFGGECRRRVMKHLFMRLFCESVPASAGTGKRPWKTRAP